jgi:hypothetical protein
VEDEIVEVGEEEAEIHSSIEEIKVFSVIWIVLCVIFPPSPSVALQFDDPLRLPTNLLTLPSHFSAPVVWRSSASRARIWILLPFPVRVPLPATRCSQLAGAGVRRRPSSVLVRWV